MRSLVSLDAGVCGHVRIDGMSFFSPMSSEQRARAEPKCCAQVRLSASRRPARRVFNAAASTPSPENSGIISVGSPMQVWLLTRPDHPDLASASTSRVLVPAVLQYVDEWA